MLFQHFLSRSLAALSLLVACAGPAAEVSQQAGDTPTIEIPDQTGLFLRWEGEHGVLGYCQLDVTIRRSDGSIKYLSMEDGQAFKKTGASASDDEGDGVASAGQNKWTVEQFEVDRVLENPGKLYSQVRAVPHRGSDGEIDGYQLSRMGRKSVFKKLGFKNGDIVHAVNGKSMTSMDAALDTYNSLAHEKEFNCEITRRDKRQTFEYEIR